MYSIQTIKIDKFNIKYINCLLLILLSFELINEITVYSNIGKIHKERLKQINECISNNCSTLYLKKIPQKYNKYHMDINLPNKKWFTYKCFIDYYQLPKDIEIIYK